MSNLALEIKNLSKEYFLGRINSGTLSRDLSSFLAKIRKTVDPNSKLILKEGESDKKPDKIWALKNITLNVKKGEIIGIIGKNGAGKSTLLKILSRITSPTTGEVKIYGKVASLLEVGTGFHPELTGRENIYLNGAILGMSTNHIKEKLNEIIDFSGIEKFIDTPIKRYSTGMKVRLGFSIAAYLDADILFVDEVLAVGDAAFREKALTKMNDLSANQKKTILFVSHNLNAMINLTENCIYLKDGRIAMQGNTKHLIQKYLNHKNSNKKYEFPKTDLINFKKISITNNKGEKKKTFFYDENIYVNYSYTILKKCPKLRIAFTISDSFGTVIFNSADFLNGDRPENFNITGDYKTSAVIPKNYFNEGDFFVGVTSDIPFKRIYLNVKKIFSFSITFKNTKTADLNERFEGSLFPKIKWNTKKT